MIELYSKDYVLKTKKQKNLLLAIFLLVIAIFLAAVVAIILIYANEPVNTPNETGLKIAMMVVAAVGICFGFFFYMLVYGRVKKYYLFLIYTVFNKYNEFKTTVINVFYQPQDNNGVDFYRLVVLEWSEHQNDFVERTILVDAEKSIDGVKAGDIITVRVAANTLLAYGVEVNETK